MRECVYDYVRLCERDEIFRERECVHGCLQAFVSECVCVRLCENDKIECRCVRVKENLSICEKERQKEKKREKMKERARELCAWAAFWLKGHSILEAVSKSSANQNQNAEPKIQLTFFLIGMKKKLRWSDRMNEKSLSQLRAERPRGLKFL